MATNLRHGRADGSRHAVRRDSKKQNVFDGGAGSQGTFGTLPSERVEVLDFRYAIWILRRMV